jgi:YVTN family beta-propeller protein
MAIPQLAVRVLLAGLIAGCATSPMGDDNGGDDDGPVPFTNGVSTLSGQADPGFVDGARKVAKFSNPVNVAFRNGTLYVADFDNNKLRAIDTTSHVTSTVIAQAGFARPFGLAFAGDGTLYVSTDNDPMGGHTLMSGSIWRIDIGAKKAVVVAASIGRPRGLAVLPDGRIAVADDLHHVIEVVDASNGRVTVIAGVFDAKGMVDGVGAAARFSTPYSLVERDPGWLRRRLDGECAVQPSPGDLDGRQWRRLHHRSRQLPGPQDRR